MMRRRLPPRSPQLKTAIKKATTIILLLTGFVVALDGLVKAALQLTHLLGW